MNTTDIRVALMKPGTKTKSHSSLPGMKLPFVTKHAFPVFLFDGDTMGDDYEYVLPTAGMVGCDIRGNIGVIDADGDYYQVGLKLPAQLDPQPLEVDLNHPFFAAAQRALERQLAEEETPA